MVTEIKLLGSRCSFGLEGTHTLRRYVLVGLDCQAPFSSKVIVILLSVIMTHQPLGLTFIFLHFPSLLVPLACLLNCFAPHGFRPCLASRSSQISSFAPACHPQPGLPPWLAPPEVNCAVVTLVYNKGDASLSCNYHLIAVTEPIMCLYASILIKVLVTYTEDKFLRASSQYWFRQHLSLHPCSYCSIFLTCAKRTHGRRTAASLI